MVGATEPPDRVSLTISQSRYVLTATGFDRGLTSLNPSSPPPASATTNTAARTSFSPRVPTRCQNGALVTDLRSADGSNRVTSGDQAGSLVIRLVVSEGKSPFCFAGQNVRRWSDPFNLGDEAVAAPRHRHDIAVIVWVFVEGSS